MPRVWANARGEDSALSCRRGCASLLLTPVWMRLLLYSGQRVTLGNPCISYWRSPHNSFLSLISSCVSPWVCVTAVMGH